MNIPKLKTVKRSVKHVFTPTEVAGLNVDFGQAYDALGAAEADFEAVKAVHKSKITEAETRMTTLRATINAGFEFREKLLVLVLDMKGGKKFFYLESDLVDGELPKTAEAVLIESITEADRQQELIEAESKFECREEIQLFAPAKDDFGVLTVGRFGKKWFGSLRVKIGTRVLTERLDSEQPTCKERFDMVKRSCKRFTDWLIANLGADEAKGFQGSLADVLAAHKEKEE